MNSFTYLIELNHTVHQMFKLVFFDTRKAANSHNPSNNLKQTTFT